MEYEFDTKITNHIPWSFVIDESNVLKFKHWGNKAKIRSLQSTGYAAAKKRGLQMSVDIGPEIMTCRFSAYSQDGRLSQYNYLRQIAAGQTINVPWDLSRGSPAPEYRAINSIYQELQNKGYQMNWHSTMTHVAITRLA